jgi:hypothetical protein
VTSEDDYERQLHEAEQELKVAETADQVRNAWRKHIGALGHRALGRLLMGRSAGELAERRAEKKEPV